MPTLILASRSPRRAKLLREAGLSFTQLDPPYDDPPPTGVPDPEAVAVRKAKSLIGRVPDELPGAGAVVVTADTMCVHAGRGVGKPADAADARRMLRQWVEATHEVITGVAILHRARIVGRFTDTAAVTWGPVADDELEQYVRSGDWRGKAGGYNLFDRRDAGWPINVTGDETTVVGLPMRRLLPMLTALG